MIIACPLCHLWHLGPDCCIHDIRAALICVREQGFCPGTVFAELLRRIRSSEALIAIVTGNNSPRCSRCDPVDSVWQLDYIPSPSPVSSLQYSVPHPDQTKTLVWLYCDPSDFELQHTNTFELTQLRTDWSCQLRISCQVLPNVQLLAWLQSVVRAPSHYCSKIAQGPCPLLVYLLCSYELHSACQTLPVQPRVDSTHGPGCRQDSQVCWAAAATFLCPQPGYNVNHKTWYLDLRRQ